MHAKGYFFGWIIMVFRKDYNLAFILILGGVLLCQNVALCLPEENSTLRPLMKFSKQSMNTDSSESTENALLLNNLLDIPTTVDSSQKPDSVFSAIDKEFIKEHDIYYGSYLSAFVARHIPAEENDHVLDFGTGSGIIAIYLSRKGIKNIVAIDNDRECIDLTRRNLEKFDLESIVKLIESDAYSRIDENEKFNTIVFSGPPVPMEEEKAFGSIINNTQIRDLEGRIIKLFLNGARNRLLKNGKVVLMYVDDPASMERIIGLGLENDLIVTKRIKFRPYSKKIENEMTEGGIRHWSVFIFERLEDLNVESNDHKYKLTKLLKNISIKMLLNGEPVSQNEMKQVKDKPLYADIGPCICLINGDTMFHINSETYLQHNEAIMSRIRNSFDFTKTTYIFDNDRIMEQSDNAGTSAIDKALSDIPNAMLWERNNKALRKIVLYPNLEFKVFDEDLSSKPLIKIRESIRSSM